MTIANINIGTSPNDGTGDTLRHGFQIVNNNFSYVNSILGGAGNVVTSNITANILTINNSATITNASIGNLTTTTTLVATTGTFSSNIYTGNLDATGRITSGNITANSTLTATTVTATTVTAGNVTASSNVSAAGAVVTGPVFGSSFFYSNGVAVVGTTGNLTLTSSNIAGANSNDGRGTVINFLPNVNQAPNGQFLTLDSETYPNISIKSGNASIATLMIGQNTHGIWLTNTGSNGNIYVQPYGGGTIINGVLTADSIISKGNITSAGNLNLINVLGTSYNMSGNIFDANTSTTVNVAMQPIFAKHRIVTANANVALNFQDSTYPIVKGTERVVYIRNTSAGNITVSNIPSYNNKGSTSTTISSGIVSRFVFFATDTTFGNIIATVTNN